jgi:TonB-dependent receptor
MKKVGFIAGLPVMMSMTAWHTAALAQDQGSPAAPQVQPPVPEEAIEEVVVTGRFISASQELVNERMSDAFSVDLLGADTISRLGDSTVGAALRRVPGLSLVQDKFVYIRGLGERYSASYLNGAQIPSPDLTRNVIPLDVFPTSVVESLRVQKSWSPGMPANFGGGSVDIRTKSVPDGFTFRLEAGMGWNSLATGDDGFTYAGGGDDSLGTDDGSRALSPTISSAINTFQGDLGVQNILTTLQRQDPTATLADAQALNRGLGLELNRQIGVQTESLDPDWELRGSIGNSWEIGEDWVFGVGAGASYQTAWRQTTARARNFNFPDERTDTEVETTRSVNLAGTLNLGLEWTADHSISTTTLWLRNTDDETAVTDFFNENAEVSDGRGFRDYRLQFEEREMLVNQIRGEHYLGDDTRERFSFIAGLIGWLPTESRINWYYSDSEAQTDIPNQVQIASRTTTDPDTAAVQTELVTLSNTAGDFRFTDLDDEVEDYGWSFTVPYYGDRNFVELTGGWSHARKARTYEQVQFSLGATEVFDPSALAGPLDTVFSDQNVLDTGNNFIFDRQGTNSESYIAAVMTDSIWGQVDWTFDDTWRFAVGARWEDYRQAAVPWNPYGFSASDPQVNPCDIIDPCDFTVNDDDTRSFTSNAIFAEDKVYPSAAITYMTDWWADTFNLRLGYSETAVRPDLREITGSTYIDPITGDLVRGNPGVRPAEISNIDLRAEWFFANGDNLTATVFHKDIDKPIEFFESPASDTTIAREIVNATSAEVQGIELEALKELAFLGGFWDTLFVQGNLTYQWSRDLICNVDSCSADAPTNRDRDLAGASEYVFNVMLGFDSPEAKHTASLIYNVFGERLYVAGRNGSPDGFEQPFHSLDLTYFWYPTDTLTVQFKAKNLLDESITIERGGVQVFEEEPGTSVAFSVVWAL